MIDVNDLRKGVTFELGDDLFKVLEYSHTKVARGGATIRVKVRNLRTDAVLEKTFNSGDRVQDVRLDKQEVQFLYADGDIYTFMDTETYEQPMLPVSALGKFARDWAMAVHAEGFRTLKFSPWMAEM